MMCCAFMGHHHLTGPSYPPFRLISLTPHQPLPLQPADIWSRYADSLAQLRDLAAPASSPEEKERALACLNHMVADALSLAPSCLRYMASLRHPDVFRFCAIPQLMAIATLDKVTNNIDIFSGVVKIRKGQALLLMRQAGKQGMHGVYTAFLRHSRSILSAIPPHHTAAHAVAEKAARAIEAICLDALPYSSALTESPFASPAVILGVVGLTAFLLNHLYARSRSMDWGLQASGEARILPRITDSWDVLSLTALVACLAYLFSFAGVPVVLRLAPTGKTPPPSPVNSKSMSVSKRAAGEEEEDGAMMAAGPSAPVDASPRASRRRPAKV